MYFYSIIFELNYLLTQKTRRDSECGPDGSACYCTFNKLQSIHKFLQLTTIEKDIFTKQILITVSFLLNVLRNS